MKKYSLLIFLLAIHCFVCPAQKKEKTPVTNKFCSIVQIGVLKGQADKTYGQFQLVNGIQRDAWFYGLGLGIDFYGPKRSVPLFLDVKRDLRSGKSTPFVYADAGYNFSWLRDQDKMSYWGYDYKTRGGLYFETGIGYKFILKNRMAFGLSAGYSYKQQKEIYTSWPFSYFRGVPQTSDDLPPDIFNYKFRRISLKVNCSF